jgi:spoIIIJ-associated protein
MVEALVAAGGLDLSVQVEQDGETERVRIDGPDAEPLLEKDAEGLAALEHLMSKMALRGLGRRARIRLDSAGYRKRREEEIVQMALRSAEKVKVEGGEFSTSPLNPYERRLVHVALKDDPSILTESEGNGFLKRVMIRTRSVPGEP